MRSTVPGFTAGKLYLALLVLLQTNPATGQFAPELGAQARRESATVVLTTGEVFADVDFEVDDRFKTVKLLLPSGARMVSFTIIESITADGQDVTAQVVGQRTGDRFAPGSAGQEWISQTDEAYRAARASPWPLALRAAGNLGMPVGDYYEGVDGGIGYEGDLLIGLSRKLALRLSFSRSGADFGDSYGFYAPDMNIQILTQDQDLAIRRYAVAAQFNRPLSPGRDDGSLAYVYGGLGVAAHDIDVDVTWRVVSDNSVIRFRASDRKSRFMTTLGGGLTKMLGRRLGVDLSAEVDLIFIAADEGSYYGSPSNALLIDGKLGLVYFFR